MRSSHVLSRLSHSFDEPNLVSHGGLSAPAMLCQRIGLDTLVACTVTVPGPCGANIAAKVATVLGGMLAGADSIDDLDVLRAGATPVLFDDMRAPSTIGSCLRSFTFGSVRQLDAVSLLSDLGPKQLDRYLTAFPSADAYRVVHLARLPVNLHSAAPWTSLTWESVLRAYAGSEHAWVSTTARAWIAQLDALVPPMSAETVWNDVPDDAPGFELALRARIAWLASQMDSWCQLEHDMVPSSGGGNWAVRLWADAPADDHFVTVELQEGLTAYEWKPNPDRPYRERLPGPVVLLGLRQEGTATSANFDWALLHRLFATHLIDPDGRPRDDRAWHSTPARPTHPLDKENWQAIVDAGAPRWLGKGWGMKVAQGTDSCLFGARFGLPPVSTLGEIDTELRRLQSLIRSMAAPEGT